MVDTQKIKTFKWVSVGLLYGSILLSLIFYIVTMAVGFKLPTGGAANLGLWDVFINVNGSGRPISITSSISDIGVCCIVFFVIALGSLIAGFVVSNKGNIRVHKYLKMSSIFSLIVFGVALILVLSAKVSIDYSIIDPTSSYNLSIWIRQVVEQRSATLEYTVVGTIVVIILSLAIVLPVIYTILALTKIPYNNIDAKAQVKSSSAENTK